MEIRNPDGHLIAKFDPRTGVVEIKNKPWITKINCQSSVTPKVTHTKA